MHRRPRESANDKTDVSHVNKSERNKSSAPIVANNVNINNDNFVDISIFCPSLRMTAYIPAEFAGKVVGKKGLIISNIKAESKLSSLEAKKAEGESLWSPILMQGDFRAIKIAYEAVAKIVEGIYYLCIQLYV